MEKRKKNSNFVSSFATFIIVVIHSVLFLFTWYTFYKFKIADPFYEKGTLLLISVYLLLFVSFSNIYGGFKIGYYRVSDVIYSQIISIIFVNIITYFQISLIAREMLNIVGIVVMTIVQALVTILWAYISNKVYFKHNSAMKVVIIYGNEDVSVFIKKLSMRPDKYNICEMLSIFMGEDAIVENISGCDYDAVMLYDIESHLRNKILKYCYTNSLKVYVTPKISDIIVGSSDRLHLFDTPLLICKNEGLSYEQRLVKRMVDIMGSLLLVVLTSPIMIVVSAAIKFSDGGPVLFKQERLTIDNRIFTIYKFRSMVTDAEKDGVARLASKNDERITSVGRVIRKIRLDELPQLFNVLCGDMSLVGPRPERPEIAGKYAEIIPEFNFRTKVNAGITGYAQVLGKYNTTAYDKLKLDLLYIENYSLVLDIKLLLMTLKILFIPEKAEGVDKGEVLPGEMFFIKDNKEA